MIEGRNYPTPFEGIPDNAKPTPEIGTEIKTDPETELKERRDLVEQKVAAARNFARDYLNNIPNKNYGRITNLHLIGLYLSRSIYEPSQTQDLLEYAKEHPETQADVEILAKALPGLDSKPTDEIIDHEKFAREFSYTASKHNLPNEPEYEGKTYAEAVYFQDAKAELEKLLIKGPVQVWTAGDTHGLPDLELRGNVGGPIQDWTDKNNHKGVKIDVMGSGEQLKRAARGGLQTLRKEHRQEDFKFDVKAAENKFELLEGIINDFKQDDVHQYVIVDDKIANLDKAKSKLIDLGILEENILLVWDRQGSGALGSDKKLPDGTTPEQIREMEGKYHAIANITQLQSTIMANTSEINKDKPIGTIIDHDDVISNTKIAGEIGQKNILNWLEKVKGII